MTDADKLVADCVEAARAMVRPDRTIEDAIRAALAVAVERCAEVARGNATEDYWRIAMDDNAHMLAGKLKGRLDAEKAVRSLSPNAKGETHD